MVDLESYIPLIVKSLQKVNPYRIYLFGSLVSGNVTDNSDIDILVWSKPEFQKLKEVNPGFVREIEEKGKIIYEKHYRVSPPCGGRPGAQPGY